MASPEDSSSNPHPLDDMVAFLKVQLKAQEDRRRIEFAIQHVTSVIAKPNRFCSPHKILVNGSYKFTIEDGRVAMRILTSFLRGATFELTPDSVDDIFKWKENTHYEYYHFKPMEDCVRKQKEFLFHLLGKVPQVAETKRYIRHTDRFSVGQETKVELMTVSAVFSYA